MNVTRCSAKYLGLLLWIVNPVADGYTRRPHVAVAKHNELHQVLLMCFRDPLRVPRIRENYHRVPRIRQIGSLQVHTRCL